MPVPMSDVKDGELYWTCASPIGYGEEVWPPWQCRARVDHRGSVSLLRLKEGGELDAGRNSEAIGSIDNIFATRTEAVAAYKLLAHQRATELRAIAEELDREADAIE